jgi:tetratricopeptide (TPR) repeat protein
MAPTRLTNVRGRTAFFALGGPVASLVLAGVSCIAALTAKGHVWESSWGLLSMMASIAWVDFLVNLVPQKPEAHYSDGARIYQLVTNGPWSHVEQAFSMVASSLVTARRPRDYDLDVFRAAGNFLTQGDRAMLLRLFACIHYLDSGRIAEALASLEEAERLYENVTLQNGAGICAEFVFINAVYKRDRTAAELWWQRLQGHRRIDRDAEYWQAQAGLLWLQGQHDQARKAYERGYALALELPAAGAYDYTRSGFDVLHTALNEAPDNKPLAVMLAAISSDQAAADAPVSDPVS